MEHLGARGLDDATHDADGGIVTIEQTGGSDDSDLVLGNVGGRLARRWTWCEVTGGALMVRLPLRLRPFYILHFSFIIFHSLGPRGEWRMVIGHW